MTATPVQLLLKNSNAPYNNDETVYTMNNEALYGKIIYEYSFFQGINDMNPVLVPFETIYYTAKDEIPEDIKQTIISMDKMDKQKFYFETISDFLIENIKKYKLKYILVYLQNKEKVKMMKTEIENIMTNQNINYNVYTVLSNQSKTERNKNLSNFKKYIDHANILLSVGIFNEGTDIPFIDSVMFAEERNTESTIVQNIGRCLRLSPETEKKNAYIIIPNIVYEFNTDNTNLSITNTYSSCYKKIREVISILKKPCKNKFYNKYVKGDTINCSDDEDNDKSKKDSKQNNKQNNEVKDNIDVKTKKKQLTKEELYQETLSNQIFLIENKIKEYEGIDLLEYTGRKGFVKQLTKVGWKERYTTMRKSLKENLDV